ncbi:MAG: carboxypeptidase regulatory-like domain-containing protein [Deltaproteobacteria bacterium]|nr:carboxypeptidase regulatory-like domain-containing protein [Deltaproteobacteria bacterium]
MKHSLGALLAMLMLAVNGAALGGTLAGNVSGPAGQRIAGALVTVTDTKRGLAESVYSDATGRFSLKTQLSGTLVLRVRAPYFNDLSRTLELLPDGEIRETLILQSMTSPEEISDSLPAAYHFADLPFEEGTPFGRSKFQRDCISCHQLGNSITRTPRPADAWEVTVRRMHGYLGNADDTLAAARSQILANGFDGKRTALRPKFPFDPMITRARIVQYRLDKAEVPHDAEVSPDDGLVYTVDQFAEQMAITNLETGQTDYVPMPAEGSPVGGKFATLGMPLLFNRPLHRGPHSLAIGTDGKWYTTDSIADRIGVFDPRRRQWDKSFEIGGKSLYPHTIRFDRTGHAWFTLAYSEQVGRLDPKTGQVDLVDLPANHSTGASSGSVPYGIDVHPGDGTIWYSRLFSDKVGRIDPKTLEVVEYDSPVKGPRRMRFGRDGTLWITGFSEGMLARVDTRGFKAKVYRMPEFAPGCRPAPYALALHPDTQEIWINEVMTDRVYRFLPKRERFVAYPMPLRGTYTRDMSFTKDGRVCASNNPFPQAALEGGTMELICIDPEGAAGEPAHIASSASVR